MKKYLIILILGQLFAESGFPGFNAWTSSSRLAMGGAGQLIKVPVAAYGNPAALSSNRNFSTSFVHYPAGIHSQAVAIVFPKFDGQMTFALKRLSYGVFERLDEDAVSTGNYTSSDTWINAGYSNQLKTFPINYGFTGGLFFSNLDSYLSTLLYLSSGMIWMLKEQQAAVGLSLDNIGFAIQYTTQNKDILPVKISLGITKRLVHLPLTLAIDIVRLLQEKHRVIFIGGIFHLPHDIKFKWGTSTRKFDQNIRQEIWKSILGATGLGLHFNYGATDAGVGTYFYGTGGWITGMDLSVRF
ncbi:MAG: hypothetical protein CMO16_06350 [Thaumarchaeota archaeon]|nr:hypothetical protein [Nitrososphaerota archaeon]